MNQYDHLLDVRGEACPMPLLKAKMQLNAMRVGETVKVMASDAGSVRDFAAFINLTQHSLKEAHLENEFIYFITKND
jgi:tRNA 2-thiouridine synthesizing protein A